MNNRKRRAPAPVLPTRSAKVPRIMKQRYDGQNSSPSENLGLLARWLPFTLRAQPSSFLPIFSSSKPRERSPSPLESQACLPSPSPTTPQETPSPPKNQGLSSVGQTKTLPPKSYSLSYLSSSPPSTSKLSEPSHTFSRHSSSTRVDQALSSCVSKQMSESFFYNGPQRKYKNREHIFAKVHKEKVLADRKRDREDLQQTLFRVRRASGYSSDYETFKTYLSYRATLERLERSEALSPSPSLTNLRSPRSIASPGRRHSDPVDCAFLERALYKARQTMKEPKPPKPFTPSFEMLMEKARAKDAEIEGRLRKLPSSLPPQDEAKVDAIMKSKGVLSKYAREQVTDQDLLRLRPGQWLNDEIINFYGALILGRSEGCKENPSTGDKSGGKPLKCHYFSTFFWPKFKGEGYEKSRIAKWTKKFDIFEKDVVLIPVNHNNSHWTAAAINFRRKRIESYDSMNMDRGVVCKYLRAYLDAEHRNKKKKPFDFTGWVDYTSEDTPQQENCYDCGVFTCCFLESLSRGVERFRFTQENMAYLRRRMIWEIGNARLRDDYI